MDAQNKRRSHDCFVDFVFPFFFLFLLHFFFLLSLSFFLFPSPTTAATAVVKVYVRVEEKYRIQPSTPFFSSSTSTKRQIDNKREREKNAPRTYTNRTFSLFERKSFL